MAFRFIRERAEIRFWSKVNKTPDCWIWMGAKTPLGYGNVRFNGRWWRAPRLSWFLAKDVEPSLHVLHRCDNPSCVNPAHLFLGTDQDNVDDMNRKGRQRKGYEWIKRRNRDAMGRFAGTATNA
jgi:hypothetical protein